MKVKCFFFYHGDIKLLEGPGEFIIKFIDSLARKWAADNGITINQFEFVGSKGIRQNYYTAKIHVPDDFVGDLRDVRYGKFDP